MNVYHHIIDARSFLGPAIMFLLRMEQHNPALVRSLLTSVQRVLLNAAQRDAEGILLVIMLFIFKIRQARGQRRNAHRFFINKLLHLPSPLYELRYAGYDDCRVQQKQSQDRVGRSPIFLHNSLKKATAHGPGHIRGQPDKRYRDNKHRDDRACRIIRHDVAGNDRQREQYHLRIEKLHQKAGRERRRLISAGPGYVHGIHLIREIQHEQTADDPQDRQYDRHAGRQQLA